MNDRIIAHYRLIAELGRGSMGTVFVAEDLNLARRVAIKLLSPHLSRDKDARRRFVHEAKAAAMLEHPNICTVYDAGQSDDAPFIAMALLDGMTLKARITAGPLPIGEGLRIAAGIADGLHEAHTKGVVHRDIKPANIMLTSRTDAVIMDFGLACMSETSEMTDAGITVGTAAYLSPEQACGSRVDGRADIWAVGVLLYEMVSGRKPFNADYDAALFYSIINSDPEPLSGLRTGVPIELDRIIAKCLAKKPGNRYQHADELAVDLRRLQALSSGSSSARQAASRRRPTTSRVVFTLILLAGLFVGFWSHVTNRNTNLQDGASLAIVDFEDLGRPHDAMIVAGLSGLLQVGLTEHGPGRVFSREYLCELQSRHFSGARGPILPDQALAIARRAGASMLLCGQIGTQGESLYAVWRLIETKDGVSIGGQRAVGANMIELADAILKQIVPAVAEDTNPVDSGLPGSVGSITTSSPQAYGEFLAGEAAFRNTSPASSGKQFEEAVDHYRSAIELDSGFALAWLRQADVYLARSDFIQARACCDSAWEMRHRLGIKDRMRLESRRLQLDSAVYDAMGVYREMLVRWPDDQTILKDYGAALLYWWYWAESGEIAELGLAYYPKDEFFRELLWQSMICRGRTDEAKRLGREYLLTHPSERRGWDIMTLTYITAGEPDSAEISLVRADSMAPDDLSLRIGLAHCAALSGDIGRSSAIIEELLREPRLSPFDRPRLVAGFNSRFGGRPGMATLAQASGQTTRALEWIDSLSEFDESNDSHVRSCVNRAMILLDARLPHKALDELEKIGQSGDIWWAESYVAALKIFAQIQLGQLDKARTALSELEARPDRFAALAHYFPLSAAAEIALASSAPGEALVALAELEVNHSLGPCELETRARALYALNRADEAVQTLEVLLNLYGYRFIAHYELGILYEEMRRPEDAARHYSRFLTAWEHADPSWTQLEDARRRLAGLSGPDR